MLEKQLQFNSNEINTLLLQQENFLKEELNKELKEITDEIADYCKDNHIVIDFDYRDELSEKQINTIFNCNNAEQLQDNIYSVNDEIYEYNLDYLTENEIELHKNCINDLDINEEELREKFNLSEYFFSEIINENSIVEIEYDRLYSNTEVNIIVNLKSNYDCLCSNYYETYIYKDSYFKDMLDVLNINPATFKKECIERNKFNEKEGYNIIKLSGKFPNIKSRDNKELVSIKSLIVELENNSTSSLLTFIIRCSVSEAIEIFKQKFNNKYISFNKNTTCGLFSGFQGGGSCLELDIINPDLKIKMIKDKYTYLDINIESLEHHYTVADVYGMYESSFKSGDVTFSNKK